MAEVSMSPFSVVIPAHNESAVIARCLKSLLGDSSKSDMEVLVVCNGCSDDTAAIASSFDGVKVVDISTASKIAALNAGDQQAQYYPVAFVDADVVISGAQLSCVVQKKRADESIQVAAPSLIVDTQAASFAVRAFYNIWQRLPYFTAGEMVGSGIYILSQSGRERFDTFPDVISDDGYIRSLFQSAQRRMIKEASFTIYPPRNLSNLIKIKTRARFGNMEVAMKYPGTDIGKDNGLSDLVALCLKRPWLSIQCLIYVYVQLKTKRLSKEKFKASDYGTWERDNSSRV